MFFQSSATAKCFVAATQRNDKYMTAPSPYRCYNCTTIQLRATETEWFEYALLAVLCRPYQCPHCFRRYIRPIDFSRILGVNQ